MDNVEMELTVVAMTPDIKTDQILTNFYPPDSMAASGWNDGKKMAHREWLKREIIGFLKRGRNVIVVQNKVGHLALAELPKAS